MKLLFGIVLVSMLLIAGCTGQPEPTPAPEPVPETPPATPTTPTQTGGPVEPEPEPEEFETWNMEAMIATSQPIYCSVDYAEGDFTGSSKIWILGDKMKVETASITGGDSGYEMTMISDGTVTYMKNVEGGYAFPATGDSDCDWIVFDVDKLNACIPSDASTEQVPVEEDYDFEASYAEAPSSFHCEVMAFGAEEFATTGKVCDLTQDICDIYEGVANGSGIPGMMPEDMCGDLDGEQKAECMAALGLE